MVPLERKRKRKCLMQVFPRKLECPPPGPVFSSAVDYGMSSDVTRYRKDRKHGADSRHFRAVCVTGAQGEGWDKGPRGRRQKGGGRPTLLLEEGERGGDVWHQQITGHFRF